MTITGLFALSTSSGTGALTLDAPTDANRQVIPDGTYYYTIATRPTYANPYPTRWETGKGVVSGSGTVLTRTAGNVTEANAPGSGTNPQTGVLANLPAGGTYVVFITDPQLRGQTGGRISINADGEIIFDDAGLGAGATPGAHASSHATGGTDAITPAAIGAASADDARISIWSTASGAVSGSQTVTALNAGAAHTLINGRNFSFNSYGTGPGGGLGANAYYHSASGAWKHLRDGWGSVLWFGSTGECAIYGTSNNAAGPDANASLSVLATLSYASGGMSVGSASHDPGAGNFRAAKGLFGATGVPTTTIDAAGPIRSRPVTVGTLPSAAAVGAGSHTYVTDATQAPTSIGTAVTAGGSNFCRVYSDGTTWRVG